MSEDDNELPPWTEPRRRRGRPPGSKTKPKPEPVVIQQIPPLQSAPDVPGMPPIPPPGQPHMPPSSTPFEGYTADPLAIATRQFAILDWMQQALRNEMKVAMQRKGQWISIDDIEKSERLSNSIVRAMDGLKKAVQAADEMKKKISPAQLLEHSIRTIEGQDMATVRAIIKRLRAHLVKLAPQDGTATAAMGEHNKSAMAMIAELEDE